MTEQLDSAICIAAQLWCKPKHQHKVMDPDLCVDIAAAIRAAVKDEREKVLAEIEAVDTGPCYCSGTKCGCVDIAVKEVWRNRHG